MAFVVEQQDRSGWVALRDTSSGSSVVVAPERGALVRSFVVGGRELLYLDEATFADAQKNVRGGIPVLFPSPGRLHEDRWQRDGRSGAMKQHGFARNAAWQVAGSSAATAARVDLVLRSDAQLQQQFPWQFRVELRFALKGSTLRIESSVENLDTAPMPYAFGFHPYFAVPDKASATVVTNATRAYNNVTKGAGAFTGFDFLSPEVDVHLQDHSLAVCDLQIAGVGAVRLRASQGFRRWVVWALQDKPFICVEPWTAGGDALNTGELLQYVAPKEIAREWVEMSWIDADTA